jgi:hypothetical protein
MRVGHAMGYGGSDLPPLSRLLARFSSMIEASSMVYLHVSVIADVEDAPGQ